MIRYPSHKFLRRDAVCDSWRVAHSKWQKIKPASEERFEDRGSRIKEREEGKFWVLSFGFWVKIRDRVQGSE